MGLDCLELHLTGFDRVLVRASGWCWVLSYFYSDDSFSANYDLAFWNETTYYEFRLS